MTSLGIAAVQAGWQDGEADLEHADMWLSFQFSRDTTYTERQVLVRALAGKHQIPPRAIEWRSPDGVTLDAHVSPDSIESWYVAVRDLLPFVEAESADIDKRNTALKTRVNEVVDRLNLSSG
jgi:hypothetical protein